MKARWSENFTHIILDFDSQVELEQIGFSFTKKERNFFFKDKKAKGSAKIVKFFDGRRIPSGLWQELLDICKRFGFPLNFTNFNDIKIKIDKEITENFFLKVEEKIKKPIRDEQKQMTLMSLQWRFSSGDLSVSVGKTLLLYLQAYLVKKLGITDKKILIIFPKPGLVIQTYNTFVESNVDPDFTFVMLHGESNKEKTDSYDCVLSNFQFLANKPPEFFHQFGAILVDESHRNTSSSIRNAIDYSINHTWRSGITGSIRSDKNNAEYYNFLVYSGPTIKVFKKRESIDKGYSTDGKVIVFKLNYLKEEIRKQLYMLKYSLDGDKVLMQEENIVRSSKLRLEWICKLAKKFENKNILVFFKDVKGGYGKKIVNKLKETTENRTIFYVDENVPEDHRTHFKEEMELGSNHILVASYATWSTGESVDNLHVVICAESIKDEILLSQAMGRPMRKHSTKDGEFFYWIDIVDDFSIDVENQKIGGKETHRNYMLKWFGSRKTYYESEEFSIESHNINLKNEF